MTITFVPGEACKATTTLVQGTWKSHHVVVYGSGNNLIISVGSSSSNQPRHLQTIYLPADPRAIAINAHGVIAVAVLRKIVVFTPNHYVSRPQWVHSLEVDHDSEPTALQWAVLEDELAVGSLASVSLYSLYEEYGRNYLVQRWNVQQANPVTLIWIARKADKILTTSGSYDRLVKVWTRVSYGDNTAFELAFLDHPKGTFVVDCHLRVHDNKPETGAKSLDGSIANIKNIRGYIDTDDDDNQIVYTVSNTNVFQVWASFEYSGHSHIRSWAQIDLSGVFGEEVASVVVVENHFIRDYVSQYSDHCDDLDLLLVVSSHGRVAAFTISNISYNPPNNIKIERIGDTLFEFGEKAFPTPLRLSQLPEVLHDSEFYNSEQFLVNIKKPISILDITLLNPGSTKSKLAILIHDRIKNTIRLDSFSIAQFFVPREKLAPFASLLDKFQGHTKSIRKLVKSSDDSILLSISNFASHNYVWEPIFLDDSSTRRMTITKRYRIDVSIDNDEDNAILDALIISNVNRSPETRHVVVTLQKGGFISLWDCNSQFADQSAGLIKRLKVDSIQEPKAFVLTELPSSSDQRNYCVVAIYESDLVASWKILLEYSNGQVLNIDIAAVPIEPLPQQEQIHQIESIDVFLAQPEKNLVSVINTAGYLRIYALDASKQGEKLKWKLTSEIHTNVVNASKIQGTAVMNKLAIVDESGLTLTIWDIKSGVLEYQETFPKEYGTVRDLDWTFINASNERHMSNTIFSVGFGRFVLLYTQLRYDYTNHIPTYAVLKKIDISDYTTHEIGDLIWLSGGYLVIGSGNQFFIDDKWVRLASEKNTAIDSIIRQLMTGYTKTGVSYDEKIEDDGAGYQRINKSTDDLIYDIGHLAKILNGPLPVYHPQFLIQCLFMNQVKLVQDILVKLFQNIRKGEHISWDLGLDMVDEILKCQFLTNQEPITGTNTPRVDLVHESLSNLSRGWDLFDKFNSELADLLIDKLMKISLPLLTRHQQSTLVTIVTIAKTLKKHALSLDRNGIRFLIGFKLFQMSSKQPKLSMRDINWALHSDNKEMLLSLVEDHYKHRMTWDNVRQTGLVYWVETPRLVKIMEGVARNEFSEERDPSGRASLIYLALRKKHILIGLWKTVSHPDQAKMIKFLNNDFNEPRWRSAALKNAFVLLGKHRYLDAACFFLLGNSVKDCCLTLANKVNDRALAIAVSKISNGGEGVDVSLLGVIENFIIPDSIESGDRWTTSWIFWQMGLKECSIQALIRTPLEIIKENREQFSELCNKNYIDKATASAKGQSFLKDDPVLIILFNELRNQKINYLKGSLTISTLEESQFLLKVCMIYTRMGCDYLSILLLKNWTFNHGAGTMSEWNERKTVFQREETVRQKKVKQEKEAPPASVFEEPDMSAFDFGF
ncbi:regulator of V-ATPase [Suhomyces tanzawaensis NRRL Y-17324]|uniref:Regulator of V-ATPase n=1 Tax=Suhomyces tanzawaensis NRRL Y-17324 TaxID=984487 RepID=A0A1E4SBB5_9ASCO|nr:regulator of V-ATPase [Suhomyces tanzawaensis NRRL Y-17324]ODV76756.1 regulator of V-ATPase [Suhomyces tanzawaensis NRRL Y-17324]